MNERRARLACLVLLLSLLNAKAESGGCPVKADVAGCPTAAQKRGATGGRKRHHGNSLLSMAVNRTRTRVGGARPMKVKIKAKGRFGIAHNPWGSAQAVLPSTVLKCKVSHFAPLDGKCPGHCPFFSADPHRPCHWRCLRPDECGKDDPMQTVTDWERMQCRSCMTEGCWRCSPGKDLCEECASGYHLVDGACRPVKSRAWTVGLGVVGVLLAVVLAWYASLMCGEAVNPLKLKQALVHRARASLRHREEGRDSPYSLFTKLWCSPGHDEAPTGGPGLMLLFRFQLFVLAVVLVILIGWCITAMCLGNDILVVGTYAATDPMEMCRAVRWGRQVRDKHRWGKLLFTVTVYVVSTLFAIVFAVWQKRSYQEADSKSSTMMDYAAICTGFPPDGGPDLEEDIRGFVQAATGCRPVGVSVCWDYAGVEQRVMSLVTNEVRRREVRSTEDPCFRQSEPSPRGDAWEKALFAGQAGKRPTVASRFLCICRPLLLALRPPIQLVDMLFGFHHHRGTQEGAMDAASAAEADRLEAEEILQGITCAGTAFVVHETERDRDATIQALSAASAPLYKGQHKIGAVKGHYEPQTVCWANFAVPPEEVTQHMLIGCLVTLGAIVIWGACFYAPYAYFESQTYIATGKPPGTASELTFSMLVVGGNQIMYLVCSMIAERVGFRSKDHVQEAYVVLYTVAVLVNTVVDILIMVCTTYIGMVARGVRTDSGVLLKDLPDSTAVFESYPMMKVFGETLYQYNFPACFLLPFVMEALFTVVLPLHLGYRLVRSRHTSRENAEACLQPIPMDAARYGDIIVNVTLAAVCFFTASGWILRTFLGLLVGNLFIYAFDHYRVLRHVEDFYMSTGYVEMAAQRLMAIPCAVLATAAVFQLHTLFPRSRLWVEQGLWVLLGETFLLHVLLHVLLLRLALRCFGKVQHSAAEESYTEVARRQPGNWFTLNPVHCLRSLYLHVHVKPCIYNIPGKEAYLECDEARGLHFEPQHRIPEEHN